MKFNGEVISTSSLSFLTHGSIYSLNSSTKAARLSASFGFPESTPGNSQSRSTPARPYRRTMPTEERMNLWKLTEIEADDMSTCFWEDSLRDSVLDAHFNRWCLFSAIGENSPWDLPDTQRRTFGAAFFKSPSICSRRLSSSWSMVRITFPCWPTWNEPASSRRHSGIAARRIYEFLSFTYLCMRDDYVSAHPWFDFWRFQYIFSVLVR